MSNTMLLFVNMASAMCLLTIFELIARIFILWHKLFVVQVMKSAISATYVASMSFLRIKNGLDHCHIVAFIPNPSK